MYNHSECSNWIGGVWHNQLRYKLKLDSGHSSRELHNQQLHRIEEWNFDRNCNRHIIRRYRTFTFDGLQLHG
jgi:hypothetical protein